MKPGDFDSLEEKLQYLEEHDVMFHVAYKGKEEVITAVFPDGTFFDWHWLESNDDGTSQWFKPTEFVGMVDEVLEFTDENGFISGNYEELKEKYDGGRE